MTILKIKIFFEQTKMMYILPLDHPAQGVQRMNQTKVFTVSQYQ